MNLPRLLGTSLMSDVAMYRTRLENLVNHPRPGSDGREDQGEPPDESGGREGGSVDRGGFRVAGPTPGELDGLLRIRDLHGFIEQAYHVILQRPADLQGASGHAM